MGCERTLSGSDSINKCSLGTCFKERFGGSAMGWLCCEHLWILVSKKGRGPSRGPGLLHLHFSQSPHAVRMEPSQLHGVADFASRDLAGTQGFSSLG
ncbi:hypothetical protein OIN59_24435, partial [Acidovorax sp. D2M1]